MRGDRTKPYVEDSTKGNSMINPLNYKGDVLVQVWIDSRVLATLCRWLDKQGTYSRFMSQVVRRPLEVLADTLVDGGDVEVVDDTSEARVMLERRFGVDLSRGGRGTKNKMHNVVLSARRGELSERLEVNKRFNDVSRPGVFKRRFSIEEIETAANSPEALRRAAELRKDREGKREIDKSPVVGSTQIDEMPTLKEGVSQEEIEERMRASEALNRRREEEMNELLGIG